MKQIVIFSFFFCTFLLFFVLWRFISPFSNCIFLLSLPISYFILYYFSVSLSLPIYRQISFSFLSISHSLPFLSLSFILSTIPPSHPLALFSLFISPSHPFLSLSFILSSIPSSHPLSLSSLFPFPPIPLSFSSPPFAYLLIFLHVCFFLPSLAETSTLLLLSLPFLALTHTLLTFDLLCCSHLIFLSLIILRYQLLCFMFTVSRSSIVAWSKTSLSLFCSHWFHGLFPQCRV